MTLWVSLPSAVCAAMLPEPGADEREPTMRALPPRTPP